MSQTVCHDRNVFLCTEDVAECEPDKFYVVFLYKTKQFTVGIGTQAGTSFIYYNVIMPCARSGRVAANGTASVECRAVDAVIRESKRGLYAVSSVNSC